MVLCLRQQSLWKRQEAEIVALDKTGTITNGEPRVTDIIPGEGMKESNLLRYAYALEQKK